jgi:two-component sensor histidine kinase/methyl-accepting chemotaxis protein
VIQQPEPDGKIRKENSIMNIIKSNSIRHRFTFALATVITLVMLVFSVGVILYNSQSVEKDLQKQIDKLTVFSTKSLSIALWQFNYGYIKDYINSLLLYEDIAFASVLVKDKEIVKKVRPGFKELLFSEFSTSSRFISKETTIIHNGVSVGVMRLVISRSRIRNLIISTSTLTILILLLVNLTIFGTNYFLSNWYLFKPLAKLEGSVKAISSGKLDSPIDVSGNDEIGQLAQSFEHMMGNLKMVTASRDELNNEIKERKQAEKLLLKSNTLLTSVINQAPIAIHILEGEANSISVVVENSESARIMGEAVEGRTGIDADIPEMLTTRFFSIDGKQEIPLNKMPSPRAFKGEAVTQEEFLFLHADGNRIIVEASASPVYNENQQIIAVVVIFQDITLRKQSENQIKAALKEKEVLFKEIHHRVKNNMQIIQSLLSLHSNEIRDPEHKKPLIDSNNRIKSMALIHEILYRSDNMAVLDLQTYFYEIVQHLFKIYCEPGCNVVLNPDIDPVELGMDLSIACGLIINELVSNALKYAFVSDSKGDLFISLKIISANEVLMTVKDNGPGLPTDLDLNTSDSLGLKIVKILVEGQLKGSMKVKNDHGTSFEIYFPFSKGKKKRVWNGKN